MGDLYYEQLVAKKNNGKEKLIGSAMLVLAILSAAAGLFLFLPAMIPAILLAVGSYLVSYFGNLEYEYIFVNGDLDIDKIVSKSRRKKVKSIKMEEIELMAPMQSHRLDYYNGNKNLRIEDYSSGTDVQKRYIMLVKDDKGLCKIILEPDEVLAKTMKNCSPGKIFLD